MRDIKDKDLLVFIGDIYSLLILEKNYGISFGTVSYKDLLKKMVKYLPRAFIDLIIKRFPKEYLTEAKLCSFLLLLGSPYCFESAEDLYKRFHLLSAYTGCILYGIKKDPLVNFIQKEIIDLHVNEIEYILKHRWYFLESNVDLNEDSVIELIKHLRLDRHKLRFQNNFLFWGREKPPEDLKEFLLRNALLMHILRYYYKDKRLSDAIGINIVRTFATMEYYALRSIKKVDNMIKRMFDRGIFNAEIERWCTLVQEKFGDEYYSEAVVKALKKVINIKKLELLEDKLSSPFFLLYIFFTNANYRELGSVLGKYFSKGLSIIKEFTSDLKINPSDTYFKLACNTIKSFPDELRKEILKTISHENLQYINFCL